MQEETGNPIPVKIHPDLIARADKLIAAVQADPDLSATLGRVTRASVIRLALVRGLASLENRAKAGGR